MQKEDLFERFRDLDEDVDLSMSPDDDRRFRVIIVGGGALILLDTITRATMDIDVINVDPAIAQFLEEYEMNTRVKAYAHTFAYNMEDRIKPIWTNSKRVEFYAASLEDIVAAKLSSEREKDREDLVDPAVIEKIDWGKLEEIALGEDELKINMLNERHYQDFLYNYYEYVRRYKPCDS